MQNPIPETMNPDLIFTADFQKPENWLFQSVVSFFFVYHYLDSQTKNRFEQIKTNIKFCVIKFWIKRYKIGFSSGEQVIY